MLAFKLYKLSKDLLVKLIATIQDPKLLTDEEIIQQRKRLQEELIIRRTQTIKNYLLNNPEYAKFKEGISLISKLKLKISNNAKTVTLIVTYEPELISFQTKQGNYLVSTVLTGNPNRGLTLWFKHQFSSDVASED